MVKNSLLILPVIILSLTSCSVKQAGLFGKKTPHEKYKSGLDDAGLSATRLGILWLAAANESLIKPVPVNLPYKETGYFEMALPKAAGYIFSAKQGELVKINVITNPQNRFLLFTELWEVNGSDKKLLAGGDSTTHDISFEIKKNGLYLMRMQPELLQALAYTITINTAPSLAFPVNKENNPQIISVWGDSRDANARKHEGIDILAKKYTPVIAIAKGTVTSVSEGGLGGKIVFMQPEGRNYNLYYAHLDRQLVQSSKAVSKGDTLGLIGNTGNAKYTAAHLHFGIYTGNGAVNPLPFINTNRGEAQPVKADTASLTHYARIKSKTTAYMGPSVTDPQKITLASDRIVKITAATGDLYKIELPDGRVGFVKSSGITEQPLRRQVLAQSAALLDGPEINAAIKKQLMPGSNIEVRGIFENYYYVTFEKLNGWIKMM